ncbi:Peroxidase [Thalictrum thalictroides]|uniref:peroxidase n=1 Tax=Thalictrum thalictroides TaxID=46969 RepID=A0A7J6UTF5_THATH|nr:Peroxidase [Thalictrum thalictroides]
MSSSASLIFLVLISSFLLGSHSSLTSAQTTLPPLVAGLSYDFHTTNCPSLQTIIRDYLREIFNSDIGVAAALLRVHFHDCFVQGCDGSVLLAGSASGPGEQQAPPNLTLRARAFVIIEELRNRIHRACGAIVSCSDIAALSARDAVFLSGGPDYRVPLGRRDGLNFATVNATLANLPFFGSRVPQLTADFAAKNLDVNDLVALSGGHTIGRGSCGSFVGRLFPTRDPTLETTFADNLTRVCPTNTSTGFTPLDVRTPNNFDNQYYVDLVNRQGLFTSDQDLFTDNTTAPIVTSFANNQTLFFERFAFSMLKMGMINVTTGAQGEIRTNCSARNTAATTYLTTDVDQQGKNAGILRDAMAQSCLLGLRVVRPPACGALVSCSDIATLSARDAVFLSGGPDYQVPLGRRDGLDFATENATLANLPFFGSRVPQLTADFAACNSPGFRPCSSRIGRGNCGSFVGRLYPTRGPTLETTFANNLTRVCPTNTSLGVTPLDVRTPNNFNNQYYVDLVNRP